MRVGGVRLEGVTWRRNGQVPAVVSSVATPAKTRDSWRRPGSDPCARPTAIAKRELLTERPNIWAQQPGRPKCTAVRLWPLAFSLWPKPESHQLSLHVAD